MNNMKTVSQLQLEPYLMCLTQSFPDMSFRMEASPYAAEYMISAIKKYWSNLQHEKCTSREIRPVKKETKTIDNTTEVIVYDRPIDHLYVWLSSLHPFIESKLKNKIQSHTIQSGVIHKEVSEIHETWDKHYHIIPDTLYKSDSHRFIISWLTAWGEKPYTGTPEEWDDLVKMRDYLLEYNNKDFDFTYNAIKMAHRSLQKAYKAGEK